MQAGRLSIRLDAVYCALAAVTTALFAVPISERLAVPPALIWTIAVGVGGWAYALHRLAARRHLRPWLVSVFIANVVVAALIAVLAAALPWDGWFTVLLVAVAAEVGAFAIMQAVALQSRSG